MFKEYIKSVIPESIINFYHFKLGSGVKHARLNNNAVAEYDLDQVPLFKSVEIETLNRCNGVCPFCPVNANEKQRPYAKMTDELFKKIIDELSEIEYAGILSLYSNNEPFLDERIIEFHKYAREKVPKAEIVIFTNGSLLTVDKLIEILPYLDRMVIDNYNDDIELNANLVEVHDYVSKHKEASEKVFIDVRKQNEVRFSRGGQAPNKKKVKAIPVKCVLLFQQLIIRPDGKVSLCCNDALGKYTLGDCNEQGLLEIWHSEEYKKVRESMKKNGRKQLMLCNACDTIGGIF
ncbi:MAG: SPASM domain-containing protein [Lachnospiraceae bacterium]|nr:SPASM domain-containing protein [Lachnospiraceae bacterium]